MSPTTAVPSVDTTMTPAHSSLSTPRVQADRFDLVGKHVFMIGIGGCGMSGLARLMKARGAVVTGSDQSKSETTDALKAESIGVSFDQDSGALPEACDMVVASAAIKPDHPQVLEAQRRGVATLLYAEALGQCMIGRTGIAIAGTHGKSTTTAMIGAALTDAGLDPSVIVGATCSQLVRGSLGSGAMDPGAGFRLGSPTIPIGPLKAKPGILIAEACEFNRSFHNYRPLIASISSVEADHLDVYGSLDAVVESFHEFARLVPPESEGGRLLIAHDGAHRREVTRGLTCKVETIGFSPEADWVVEYDVATRTASLSHERKPIAKWTMLLPGAHNAVNAATALALGVMVGGDPAVLARSLSAFAGVDRRMHYLGDRILPASSTHPGGAVKVYDDYGHHPTEVDVTLRALRDFDRPQDRGGRLICVFQPHQHSRTRHLLEEFAQSFTSADVVIVPHIYFVRDSQEEKTKVNAQDLVDRLRSRGVRAMHLYPFEAIVEQLENLAQPGDLLVVMGAGPVWQVARDYLAGGPSRRPAVAPR
ncbi:MAG: Mur ligase domain-containing protein [Planctomycetota bacterium]|nr:Mur ligase domain-containing protein [Planctomycetota bacterium]